jgi:hypothetical protein
MELNDNFILPKYVIDLWCVGKSKPVPSVWDFGFVTDSVFELTGKNKPFFEIVNSEGKTQEAYYKTPEYDIYLKSGIDGYEMFLLYNSETKDSVLIASTLLKKHKIKFEE